MDDNEQLELLLSIHDGDDRCGCLAGIAADLARGRIATADAVTIMRACLAEHPAGATWRGR